MSLLAINTSPYFYKRFGVHTHECYELILNLEGEGIMTIGDKQSPFFPGSIHIIPKSTPHIKVSQDKFKDIYFLTDTLSLAPISIDESSLITFCDDAEKTLEKLMRMMLFRYLQGNKKDSVLEAMYELALKIIEDSLIKKQSTPTVEAVVQDLTLSFNEPELSVSNILEKTGYSKDHIRRKFIDERGVSPVEYLTSLRVAHAKKLLRKQKELNLPISEIGTLCGYYDPRYFARIFKKETGLTPSEYIKKHSK